MVYFGGKEIKGVYFGAEAPKAAWFNGQQIWSGEEPPVPVTGPWLCFTAAQANSTVRLDKFGSNISTVSLETSTNGSTWTDYSWSGSTGGTLALANVGDKVYMRAKTENSAFSYSSSSYYKFIMSGKIAASGNIQTLLKADGSRTDAPVGCYVKMFLGCSSLTTAPALPATTLAGNCYNNMFEGCTSLTTAPALPATTLASRCYSSMFKDCTSLTSAPALPATTLTEGCYSSMFYDCSSLTAAPTLPATTATEECYSSMFAGCTSLTTAPSLPATTLANSCYISMFYDCSSLTAAPTLPATTLDYYCYSRMFSGCSSLSSIEVAFTDWNLSSATQNWLVDVAASGTFTCPADLPDTRGVSNIPYGWAKKEPVDTPLTFKAGQANSLVQLNKQGAPNSISLEYSYDKNTWTDYSWSGNTGDVIMLSNVNDKVYFRAKTENQTVGNSSSNYYKFIMSGRIAASGNIQTLLKADGSRTDVPTYCYYQMFEKCTALTTAPALLATTLGSNCYYYMFGSCSFLTTAPALPATTLAESCYEGMFFRCTALTSAPELPATTLANSCYQGMFSNCVSLRTVPALPATTLANSCYLVMFDGCTGLTDAGNIRTGNGYMYDGAYMQMFANCTNITAVSFPDAYDSDLKTYIEDDQAGMQSIFENCDPSTIWVTYIGGADWLSALMSQPEGIEGVKFTNVDMYGNTATVQITDVGDASSNGGVCDVVYSTDGENWNAYTLEDVISLSQNDYVIFKANGSSGSGIKSVSDSSYYKFVVSQDNVLVEGDLAYLFSDDPENYSMGGDYQFSHLFENCGFAAYSQLASKYSSLKMPEEGKWMAVSYSNVFSYIFANATLARITIPADSSGWTNGWSANYAYANWVYGISDGGEGGIMTLPSYFSILYGDSYIPNGWSYEQIS